MLFPLNFSLVLLQNDVIQISEGEKYFNPVKIVSTIIPAKNWLIIKLKHENYILRPKNKSSMVQAP